MTKRGVAGILLVVAAIAVVWWRTRGDSGTDATTKPSQPVAGDARVATSSNNVAAAALVAHVTVTVTDDKGPIANATVRLAPDDGEAVVLRTDAQGTVRSGDLAPGRWDVSASSEGHEPAGVKEELSPGEDERVALKLAAGGRPLTGLVTDAYGGPIAGVRVDAAAFAGAGRPSIAVASVSTGSDGRYKLTVAEGSLLVAARSPDYAAQSRYVIVGPAGATADFALVPGGVIEGVVRDQKTREPVADATVEAMQDRSAILLAESGIHVVKSGADGHFRIAGLRPGAYDLRARAGERFSLAPTKLGLGVAEQVGGVEILVGAGPVVRGKVLDDQGKPAAGVMVFAAGEMRGGTEATSAADGTFTLVGLPPGRWAILVQSEAYVAAGTTAFELATADVDVVVKVRHGNKLAGHVEPRQPCQVRLDVDDGPLGGSLVVLAPATTGPDGAFELGPVGPGKATLAARCGTGDQGSLDVEVPAAGELVIHVSGGASIAGRVVDGDGKPVPGVIVMASVTGGTEHTVIVNGVVTSGTQALTTGDGTYEVRGLTAGPYRLSVLDRGRPLRMRTAPKPVTLAATEHKTGVDLAVDRATGVIKGVVTGPDGKPIADAWVSAHQDIAGLVAGMTHDGDDKDAGPQSRMVTVQNDGDDNGGGDLAPAVTDANGRYELVGLPHATFAVIAEAQGGKLRGRASNVTPDATVDLALAGVTSLVGTVHGAKGLFTVKLDGPTETIRSFATGDKFEIERVDPGDYKVAVSSSDGNGEAAVHVIAGQTATVDITLASNAVVTGKLVDPAGHALPNVPVVLGPDLGDGHAQVSLSGPPPTTGPDGTFRLEGKPGPAMVIVLGRPPVTKRVVLEAGKTTDAGTITVDPTHK